MSSFAPHGAWTGVSYKNGTTENTVFTARLHPDAINYTQGGTTLLGLTMHYCDFSGRSNCSNINGNLIRQEITAQGLPTAYHDFGYDNPRAAIGSCSSYARPSAVLSVPLRPVRSRC
ncbi:MAG TPA: hypothetical protein VE621_14580 [Bryobacteraceae bacterium]|nr:hypothetical protein [Bryobacteraceae bacterium]